MEKKNINSEELLQAYVRLNLTKGVGCVIATRLIREYPDVFSIFSRSVDELKQIKGIGNNAALEIKNDKYLNLAKKEIELARKNNIKILHRDMPEFPLNFALQSIVAEDAPIILYVSGDVTEADKLSIGIVGMRNPSYHGIESTKFFAGQLAESGFTVVSGFARGVDIAAHEAAINAGGRTLAFIGSGLLDVYPPENRSFIKQIVNSGALISEFPLFTPPEVGNFPRRNRLIAAMSLGVLVIEAPEKSGSLITARLASEYGREVFALAGRYDDPNKIGCNRLIQDGAKMVLSTEDILNELPAEWVDTGKTLKAAVKKREKDLFGDDKAENSGSLDETQKKLLSILSTEPMHIDKISSELKLKSPETLSSLVMLEINGLVKQLAGKFFVKV